MKIDGPTSPVEVPPERTPNPEAQDGKPNQDGERAALRAALAELVAVKDLKDRTEAIHFAGPLVGEGWREEYDKGRADYIRRQPAAWDAARAALANQDGATSTKPGALSDEDIQSMSRSLFGNWSVRDTAIVRAAQAEANRRRLEAVPAGLPIEQEPKYTVNGSAIVNRASGEAIPHDEPVFIFRARDKLAAGVLGDYAAQCEDSKHCEAVEARFIQFIEWAEAHPDRMKEPDTAAAPLSANAQVEPAEKDNAP